MVWVGKKDKFKMNLSINDLWSALVIINVEGTSYTTTNTLPGTYKDTYSSL